jgi:hypothetical protein
VINDDLNGIRSKSYDVFAVGEFWQSEYNNYKKFEARHGHYILIVYKIRPKLISLQNCENAHSNKISEKQSI